VGLGGVSQALAQRLLGFALKIVYYDPRPLPRDEERALRLTRVPLPELLSTSAFLVLALPLNPATLLLSNPETLKIMKPGSFLINLPRGSVAGESAVAQALTRGWLQGYAAAIFEMEKWARRMAVCQCRATLRAPVTVRVPVAGS
jgi:lactate dehydrogenase-like 2-hydroxyacid dehydrogenase